MATIWSQEMGLADDEFHEEPGEAALHDAFRILAVREEPIREHPLARRR